MVPLRRRFSNGGRGLGLLLLVGLMGGLGLALLAGSTGGTQAAPGVAPGGSLVPFMGNPESYLGLGNGTPVAVASLPRDPVNGGGCPNCFTNPTPQGYWVGIDGSESNFRDGDAYNTRWLGGYIGGCPAMFDRTTANPAYIPPNQPGSGYNYRVHLDVNAPGAIEVYAYDPAQYYRRPPATPTDPDTADWEACQPANLNSARPYRYATTFTLYYPDTTPDDLSDDVAVPNGSRTFTDTTTLPDPHNKWFPLGTIAADPIGDYRLQVYTNDPTGVGRNQYALALGGPRAPVSGEGFRPIDKMSLYNNIRQVPTGQSVEWYLGFIPGAYAGQRVSIRAFDIGDATCATFIQLWRDGDTQPSFFDLNWTGQIISTLQTTTSSGQRPYDGQWVTLGVTLPPPGQYTDSWWKIRYIVGSSCRGSSTDRTVWEMGVASLLTETPTPVGSGTPTGAPTETATRTITPPPTHTATNTPTVTRTTPPANTPTRTATATPTCVAGWAVVSSPNVGASHNWLWDVAALSPTDIWAVGGYRAGGGTLDQTLTMHWDGLAWTHVPSPNTPQGSTLTTVAAVSSDDVWAAGQAFSSSVPPQTLIMHWNGSAWTIVPSPNPGSNGNWIRAMTAPASNDVWAVGDYPNPSFARTMTLHWDGTAWTQVPSPNIGSRLNELFGVAALAPNDLWAAGEYDAAPSGPSVLNTLLEHWDGTAWTVVPSPNVGSGENVFRDITAIAPNDVWAVGNYCGGSPCPSGGMHTLTAHWDGSAWSIVPSPNAGASVNFLEGVSATAPTDVWAVGFADSASTQQTLTMRWDGGQWVIVPSANVGSGVNRLRKVAQDRFGGAWAVGSYELGGGTSQTLVERYAGPCATTPTPTRTGTPPTATATRTATVVSTPTPTRTRTPGATATGTVPATPSLPTSTAVLPTRTPTPLPAPSATPCLLAFTDVDATNPFYGFIRCLACRGVVTGYADGTFRPYNDVTRGQLSKIIANAAALGNAIPSSRQTFSDVPGTQPFWLWIERLAAAGAISGYACGSPGEPCDPAQRPYFRPGGPATRGQISKITAVTAGWNGPVPSAQQTFADVPPGNPFWLWIEELASRGIISGYQCGGVGEPCDPAQRPYFRWGANTTRGQMSKIAANTFFPGCQTPARR